MAEGRIPLTESGTANEGAESNAETDGVLMRAFLALCRRLKVEHSPLIAVGTVVGAFVAWVLLVLALAEIEAWGERRDRAKAEALAAAVLADTKAYAAAAAGEGGYIAKMVAVACPATAAQIKKILRATDFVGYLDGYTFICEERRDFITKAADAIVIPANKVAPRN